MTVKNSEKHNFAVWDILLFNYLVWTFQVQHDADAIFVVASNNAIMRVRTVSQHLAGVPPCRLEWYFSFFKLDISVKASLTVFIAI